MPTFRYIALDRTGRQTAGSLTADTRPAALDQLMGRGLSPVSVDESGAKAAAVPGASAESVRLSATAVENFTRELANLLAAGLPLSRALHLLGREASGATARRLWAAVHDDVVGGESLAGAMTKWPRVFSPVYIAMVRAGEAGGFLPVVLQQIADFRTREQDLMGRVKAALIYPCVLTVLATGVMVFLLTFFIPRFSGIFEEFGSRLPWLTRVIVAASEGLLQYGLAALVAVAMGVLLVRRMMGTDPGRRSIERAVLKVPGVGAVIARFALVRFCRMLGTLVGAGVPLVASLRVAREAIGNQTLADAVSHAIEQVQRGTALSRSLQESDTPLFPASVIEMIAVAEETGRLDKELVRIASAYEAELDRRLRMLVALAEPAMLLVMAAVIGTVVVGMLLPVFTLQDLIR